ncbi:MAG: hypothetical protein GY870_06570, partial [archaeon]|nr:hypothetical protein [archaeon]
NKQINNIGELIERSISEEETENGKNGINGKKAIKTGENKNTLLKDQKSLLKKAIKYEKNKNFKNAIASYSELSIIADKLFKLGVVTASNDLKKYKTKMSDLKSRAQAATEEGEDSLNEQELLDQKSQLLNIALEAEQTQDYLKALVAYQQVLNIYHSLADTENAAKISDKIKSIVGMISNVDEVLQSMVESAEKHFSEGAFQNSFAEYQYAKGLCQAIGDRDTLKKVEKQLNEISKYL